MVASLRIKTRSRCIREWFSISPSRRRSSLPGNGNQLWVKMDHGDEAAWIALMNMRNRGNCFSPVSLDVHQKAIHHDNVDARNPITFIAEANTTATSDRPFSSCRHARKGMCNESELLPSWENDANGWWMQITRGPDVHPLKYFFYTLLPLPSERRREKHHERMNNVGH